MGIRIEYTEGQIINACAFIKEMPHREGIKKRRAMFKCRCGNYFTTDIINVTIGDTTSCGCIQIANRITHGKSQNCPEYNIWDAMKQRCTNHNNKKYHIYGGAGIVICERWLNSFEDFFADMGTRPSEFHSIDRYPNKKGNYEPSNCRWATIKEQNWNLTTNKMITFNGETHCIGEWAELLKIPVNVLYHRFNRNWTIERALTQKVKYKNICN